MLRSSSLIAAGTAAAALLASPVAAQSAIFAIVPTASASATAPDPDQAALQGELASDQRALVSARRLERGLSAASADAARRSVSARLFSDQLAADQQTVELQSRLDNTAASVSRLEADIGALQRALAPPPPVFESFAVPSQSLGQQAVAIAEQYLGVHYVWGGADPAAGFDCSGLVMYVYAQLGIQLPHYAASQYALTGHVDPSQLQPGDLVFFEPRSDGPGHVGIFVGGDEFIEAPHTGDVVKLASLSDEAASMGFVGATRPAGLVAGLTAFG